MEFAAAHAAIKSRLNSAWAALHPTITVNWTNDPTPTIDPPAPVLHAFIRGGEEPIACWGGPNQNLFRQEGELVVMIFVPSLAGDETALGYSDEVAAIFRTWVSGSLRFGGVGRAGGDSLAQDGNWYQIDVLAPFTNDLIA